MSFASRSSCRTALRAFKTYQVVKILYSANYPKYIVDLLKSLNCTFCFIVLLALSNWELMSFSTCISLSSLRKMRKEKLHMMYNSSLYTCIHIPYTKHPRIIVFNKRYTVTYARDAASLASLTAFCCSRSCSSNDNLSLSRPCSSASYFCFISDRLSFLCFSEYSRVSILSLS